MAKLTKAQEEALRILQPGGTVRAGKDTRDGSLGTGPRQINGRVANALWDLGYVSVQVLRAGSSYSHMYSITYAGALAIKDPDAVEIEARHSRKARA
jgi:hypothetical protein